MHKHPKKPSIAKERDPPFRAEREPPTARELLSTHNNAGRVTHDERGNALWEWAVSTGARVPESPTQGLEKLDNPTLSLIDDARSKRGLVKDNPRGAVQGYSPYDSGRLGKAQRPRKKDLRRLSEWVKLKKQAESRKPDDE